MRQVGSEFYNSETKEKFINYYLSQNGNVESNRVKRNQCCSSFSKSRDSEQKFGKDLYEFDDGENKYFVANYLISVSYATYRIYAMIYKAYLKWCAQEGFITEEQVQNNYFFKYSKRGSKTGDSVRNESLDNISNNKYVFGSEKEFVEFVDKVFGGDEHIMDAAVSYLLYYGFDVDEIIQLKIADVDRDEQKILGKKIDNRHIFEAICRATGDVTFISTAANGKQLYKTYVKNQYLIRKLVKSKTSTALNNDKPISKSYINSLFYYAKEDIENSGYGNLDISIGAIAKLRFFFEVFNVYKENGVEYLTNHYQNYLDKYGNSKKNTMPLNQFLMMKNLVR